MLRRRAFVVGLLAGAASTPLQAQQIAQPAGGSPPPSDQGVSDRQDVPPPGAPAPSAQSTSASPPPVMLGADGKPLPPGTRVLTIGPDGKPLPEGAANPPAAPTAGAGGEGIITVTGRRPRGSVLGDIPPEITLDQTDIRAYGASSLDELLQSLTPQTRSGRGRGDQRPVVLLNGRRVSSYVEIARIPPEAIERMEVLPEEVALKYGYRADQKVVNVVAFERFQSTIGQLSYGVATAGGRDNGGTGVNYLRIRGNTRFSFDADYRRSGALFESERDLIDSEGNPFDITGNILAGPSEPGGEIDPRLSGLAGSRVTVAAVPASAAAGAPSLASFVPGANRPNRSEVGEYRTLLPATERLSLNGTVGANVFGDISASLNGRFEASDSKSGLGLSSASLLLPAGNPFSPFASDVLLYRYLSPSNPLTREFQTRLAHVGTALGGLMGDWLWSFTGNYDRLSTDTRTDAGIDVEALQARLDGGDPGANPFSDQAYQFSDRDKARSVDSAANAELVLSGSIFKLPAGPVSTSFRVGLESRDFGSESVRGGVERSTGLSRDRGSVQANLDIPLTSRAEGVLPAFGNLSANLNLEVEELSDFGSLRTLGYGLYWSPVQQLSLIASVTDEDGAPTIQQLGDPVLATPNVRTFDLVRRETVDVTRISGGNPDLRADNRHVLKLGLSAQPFEKTDLSFTANYIRSRVENSIASFPTATPEIEAAFPERFTREEGGRLLRIDGRPVNFEQWKRQEVRWGFDYSRSLGKAPPGMQVKVRYGSELKPGELPKNLPPGARVITFAAGSEMANRLEGMLSRLNFSIYHTWQLENEILIRAGLPVLDLLNGSAIGSRGGESRHEIEIQGGAFYRGLGGRFSASWRSGTTVRGLPGGPDGSAGDLSFSDYATANLKLFADLGQRFAKKRWLRGTRVSIGIDNLFDSRPEVRDTAGATPIGYQPAYLDPLGRSVNITVRKLFR